jgi:hypothetical protein
MSDEDDIPSIGDCCDGKVLVCMGDDQPDQWAGWLEELVDEFNLLRDAATAHGLLCRIDSQSLELGDWSGFCEEVGVDLNQEFWEGSLVSGQFVMGWVEKKKIGTARRRGGSLLKKLHSSLVLQLKAKRIEELKSFKGLEELISRTDNDRQALLEEVGSLTRSLAGAKAESSQFQGALTTVKADVVRVNGLNGFLLGIIRGGDGIFVHGPLLRWSDGTILALTKRGRVALPNHSPHWLVIQELRSLGHPVVEVSEVTILGGWLSGPIYLQGSGELSGWDDAWNDHRKMNRKFEVADLSKAQLLVLVKEYLGRAGVLCMQVSDGPEKEPRQDWIGRRSTTEQ